MKPFRSCAALAVALIAPAAVAHHSPAAYDQGTQVAIAGTVTDFDWGNPHVYVSVQEDAPGGAGRVWEVEAFASTAMKQFGWTPQTLAEGDRVAVIGNPGRRPGQTILFLQQIQKSGIVLFDTAAARTPPSSPPTAFSATSLSGTWATLFGPTIPRFLGGAVSLGLTAKGTTAVQEFRDTVNPGADCVPFSAPVYMIVPGVRSIEVRDDVILIRGEDAAVERTVHMTLATHDGAAASVQGHSIGRWDGDVLVVDTARFAEHRMGNGGALPSGERKRLIERLELNPGGGSLTYSFTLEDPDYLAQAVMGTSLWAYRPDVPFAATPCNRDNARRFQSE